MECDGFLPMYLHIRRSGHFVAILLASWLHRGTDCFWLAWLGSSPRKSIIPRLSKSSMSLQFLPPVAASVAFAVEFTGSQRSADYSELQEMTWARLRQLRYQVVTFKREHWSLTGSWEDVPWGHKKEREREGGVLITWNKMCNTVCPFELQTQY